MLWPRANLCISVFLQLQPCATQDLTLFNLDLLFLSISALRRAFWRMPMVCFNWFAHDVQRLLLSVHWCQWKCRRSTWDYADYVSYVIMIISAERVFFFKIQFRSDVSGSGANEVWEIRAWLNEHGVVSNFYCIQSEKFVGDAFCQF